MAELGKRLRPVVALPGEKIIARAARPTPCTSSPPARCTVILRGGPVTLKEGDFFGERGLLERRPRNADVISDGYSHLLVLYRRDFDELLDRRPEVRAEIEAVAASRAAEAPTS